MDREKVIKGLEETEIVLTQAVDRGGEMAVMGAFKCLNHVTDALSLLKDRTKDYEAWAKEIGADTCVNCRHASFNRNDGKSTCPIEHNFALVKDGFCHLFMRMEGR